MNLPLFLFFLYSAKATFTPTAPCFSSVLPPQYLKLGDCQKWPCELKRGAFVTSQVVFKAPQDIDALTHELSLTYQGNVMPILYSDSDACKYLDNATCPILKDQVVSLSFETYVYSSFEKGEVLETKIGINSPEGGITCCRGKAIIV